MKIQKKKMSDNASASSLKSPEKEPLPEEDIGFDSGGEEEEEEEDDDPEETTSLDTTQHPGIQKRRRVCVLAVHVRILWTFLSLLVTATCSFALLQPYWIVNPDTKNALGMYSYCVSHEHTGLVGISQTVTVGQEESSRTCRPYGRQFRLEHLPSSAWQIACVLFGGGCALLCFGTLTSLLTSVLRNNCASRLASYTGYIQTMAGWY